MESKECDDKNQKKDFIRREILSYFKIMVCAIVISFIFTHCIVANAMVISGSMSNTLKVDDRLIGNRLSYTFGEPQRLDVIVFKFPDDESKQFIKRIIGLPGDVVEIKQGHVYVNGDQLEEPYFKEPMNQYENLIFHVPEDHYFVMGDNRNDSKDSRYWVNTYVAKDKIIAKAMVKYFDHGITFQPIQ